MGNTMKPDLVEALSGVLDGEASTEQVASVLAALGPDAAGADARDRWTRYALIGDALRGNPTPDDGFSRRLLERLRSEPGGNDSR